MRAGNGFPTGRIQDPRRDRPKPYISASGRPSNQ